MSSMTRKFKREQIKNEIKTNKISKVFHERYGYTPNLNKTEEKISERLKRKLKKILWKDLRKKKREKND